MKERLNCLKKKTYYLKEMQRKKKGEKELLERSVYFFNQQLTLLSIPSKPLLKPAKLISKP